MIEPHICPLCESDVEETDDYYRSANSNGSHYDIWCPNCGSTTSWYDRDPWPNIKKWFIPKIALDKYRGT